MTVTNDPTAYTTQFLGSVGPPIVDREAIEQARLVRNARASLVQRSRVFDVAALADGRDSNDNAVRQWVLRQRRSHRLIDVDVDGRVMTLSFQLDQVLAARHIAPSE